MENLHLYKTSVEWKEGRIGKLSSAGMESIGISTPPDFPGGVEGFWSPEHLFTASVNICLMNTFLAIAENSKLNFKGFTGNASGKVEKVDGKYMVTEIELKPVIIISEEKDKERAGRIIDKAKHACLISNSIKSKIIMEPEIVIS